MKDIINPKENLDFITNSLFGGYSCVTHGDYDSDDDHSNCGRNINYHKKKEYFVIQIPVDQIFKYQLNILKFKECEAYIKFIFDKLI